MATGQWDHLFGGAPGAAEKARQSMERSHGKHRGSQRFFRELWKRETRARRARPKTTARRS